MYIDIFLNLYLEKTHLSLFSDVHNRLQSFYDNSDVTFSIHGLESRKHKRDKLTF